MKALIYIDNITKSFASHGQTDTPVLKNISLQVAAGQMLAIMGASGSGKSTLLSIIGLLDTPDSGTYELNGKRVDKLTEKEAAYIRNRNIGYVFQSFNLIGYKTALDNVMLPLHYAGYSRQECSERATMLLERTGLASHTHKLPAELSGGQKQRVAIARALACSPALLIADEPTGALDSTTGGEIMDLFAELHSGGSTIVLVTHDEKVAAFCSRTILITDGIIQNN